MQAAEHELIELKLKSFYKPMENRIQRAKRSSIILNLIQTPQGFSLIQGTELLNKPEGVTAPPSQLNLNNSHVQNYIQKSINSSANPHQVHSREPSKTQFKRVNLYMLMGNPQKTNSSKVQPKEDLFNEKWSQYASWFDPNSIHSIQRSNIEEWIKELPSMGGSTPDELSNLYKSHRNTILRLSLETPFLTMSKIRQYICYDAYWIMKIYIFLTNYGLINGDKYQSITQGIIPLSNQNYLFKEVQVKKIEKSKERSKESKSRRGQNVVVEGSQLTLLPSEFDTSSSSLVMNENDLLSRVTSQWRPYCDYCGIHCGIVWFQHLRSIDNKEITQIMKSVNSKNPPLSEKQYEYILCAKCFCNAKFPLLLTHHDFKKISINDKMEPSKRNRRLKKKKKDRKRKEAEEEEEEEDKEGGAKEQNGGKQVDQSRCNEEQEFLGLQAQREEIISSTIHKLLTNPSVEQKMTLQETERLLELLEKYGQSWQRILDDLKAQKMCLNFTPEQLIEQFVSLPRRGVSKLNEQYEDGLYIQQNYHANQPNIMDFLCQRRINQAQQLQKNIAQIDYSQVAKQHDWKPLLEDIIRCKIQKWQGRMDHLEQTEAALKQLNQRVVKKNS